MLPFTAYVRDPEIRAQLQRCLGSDPGAGSFETALAEATVATSPRNLLIELTGLPEPLAALDQLAQACVPGTRVVALGGVNDVALYRQLRALGVADYLVKPVTDAHLLEAIQATTAAPVAEAARNRPVLVIGARGGVGGSLVAANLAWLAAEKTQRRTVLVDGDLTCGTVSLAFDVEPSRGLSEALAAPDRIDGLLLASATVRVGRHLALLSTEGAFDAKPVAADALPRLMRGLSQSFHHSIIDLPGRQTNLLAPAIAEAGVVVIVSDCSLAGMRDLLRLRDFVKAHGPQCEILFVANRLGVARGHHPTPTECEKTIGQSFACVLPEDPTAVPAAASAGKTVAQTAPGSKISAGIKILAQQAGLVPALASKGLWAKLLGREASA